MSDIKKKQKIETDASDYIIDTILFEFEDDGIWHSVIFFSESINDAKCNYDIYDKELLVII